MKRPNQSETVYNRLAELTAGGSSFADAVRRVVAETGKNEKAVRALHYNHRRKLGLGSMSKNRKFKPLTVDEALAQAKQLLSQALAAIDRELGDARADLDTAQAKYDQLVAVSGTRKADLERKIRAFD